MNSRAMLHLSVAGAALMIQSSAYAQERSFDLRPMLAPQGLPEFARQAKIQIIAPDDGIGGLVLPGLKGTYDVRAALDFLLSSTNLEVFSQDSSIVVLRYAQQGPGLGNVLKISADVGSNIQLAQAIPAAPSTDIAEEIVVTGSRVVREGYEAPTPLTVIGIEALQNSGAPNIVNLLTTMPAITGASTAARSAVTLNGGTSGVQGLDLRSLGSSRTLVLLDGQRTVAAYYTNVVDVGSFPEQLISRVDVVTGGVSAVYGSDAVAGVVNFVLDKEFVGLKGEVSAGVTNYGDDENYKVALSSGFEFAGGRGHALLSGEHMFSAGIRGDGGRTWLRSGYLRMANPAYTPANGQPQMLYVANSALSAATAGGLIVAGPLKGTAFGDGGVPYQFQFGPIVSGQLMSGGDWRENYIQGRADWDVGQSNQAIFTRISYDLADDARIFVQWNWSQNMSDTTMYPVWLPGTATTYLIRNDNAYLPNSIRAVMAVTGITSFGIGSWNEDLPDVYTRNRRATHRVNVGFDGDLNAFDTDWAWNAYIAYGSTKLSLMHTAPVRARYALAIDAVVSPATGQIVCRSTLTDPGNGCRPWNAMGIGVNESNSPAAEWMQAGGAFQHGLLEQEIVAASATGEPFSSWAGPVSLALNVEHRKDRASAIPDEFSAAAARQSGNYSGVLGSQSVLEGALEAIVPLASQEAWVKNWDLSAAVRATDYKYGGYVTTWKIGTTYALNDLVKFRVTRSRDVRAPNLQELFADPSAGTAGTGLIDRGLGNVNTPLTTQVGSRGNPGLAPEKADTTGIGIVLSPDFGLTASVDYWRVKINGAIQSISSQQVIDGCYGAIPILCQSITRSSVDGTIARIVTQPINLAVQNVEGIDIEASYRTPLSDLVAAWRGDFTLHGNMSFYLENYQDTRFVQATDSAGENSGTAPPNWKATVTATYRLQPVSVSLTGRGFSSGTISNSYVACVSACPAATVANPTINTNFMPGRFYLDGNINYHIEPGMTGQADLYVSVRNMLNNSVPGLNAPYYNTTGQTLYDVYGVVYRAGIRFKI